MRPTCVLAIVLLVAGCGGASATNAPSILPTEAHTSVPTTAPATILPPSPSPAVAPTVAPTGTVVDGLFTDPEGKYRMRVDPGWTYRAGGIAEGIEFWFLGPAEAGFTPNLNALTQVTGGVSLKEYADLSLRNAPAQIAKFKLIDSGEVVGDRGKLGFIEYTGTAGTTYKLHFLAYFAVSGDTAIVVTLTTPASSFKHWRNEVEEFLLTLRPV